MNKGFLDYRVIEGADLTGKTTSWKYLKELYEKNPEIFKQKYDEVYFVVEPTKGPISSEMIRPSLKGKEIDYYLEGFEDVKVKIKEIGLQVLFAADRVPLMYFLKSFQKEVEEEGRNVLILSDRNYLSTVSYLRLSEDTEIALAFNTIFERFCLLPNRLYLLNVTLEEAGRRKETELRTKGALEHDEEFDKIEVVEKSLKNYEWLHREIILKNNELARAQKIIDTTALSEKQVYETILEDILRIKRIIKIQED